REDRRRRRLMQEVSRVYAKALFEAAKKSGALDRVREELVQVADAVDANQDLQLFLFSPYFSSQEKQDGLRRAVTGASHELANFLDLLAENHRLPLLMRIRREFEELWE